MMSIFVFDAYGTLFDVHAAIARFRAASRARRRPHVGNLAHQAARIHLDADAGRPLRGFLDADRAGARFFAGARAVGAEGAETEIARRLFQARCLSRRARGSARAQERKGHKTGILSNGSPNMLKGAVDAAGIGGDLDAVLSVDALKMFKPRPEVYRLVTDHFKCKPGDVTFVSSNRWDVMAGTSVGFRTIWINREQDAGRISRFPAAADAERSQRAGDV